MNANTEATLESVAAGLGILLALPAVTGLVGAPLAAALAAGIKAIAGHLDGKTDAATMMAEVADVATQFKALDVEEAALDAAKFKAP